MNNSSQKAPFTFLFFSSMLLIQWSFFTFGYYNQYPHLQPFKSKLLLLSPILFLLAIIIFHILQKKYYIYIEDIFFKFTDSVGQFKYINYSILIAMAAGLGLYAELSIIRIHSSYFQLFAFFKNFSLLSCFLGLGIGYANGKKKYLTFPIVIPLLTIQLFLLNFLKNSNVEEFLQNPIPDQVAFGLGTISNYSEIVAVYGFLSFIFTLNTLCFIPFGQLASFLMEKQKLLTAYGWNLIGSIIGIVVFSVLAFLNTPPLIWMSILLIVALLFMIKTPKILLFSLLISIVLILQLRQPANPNQIIQYSPYQILSLKISDEKNFPLQLKVSNTFFQNILNLSDSNTTDKPFLREISKYYSLPYIYKPKPQNALIVGSGTGNDVASALRHQAQNIDAVEIDPLIYKFGEIFHPEKPYQNPNVKIHINDARSFIKSTTEKYDVIVYGLLDSHVLMTGNSNIRLDNYVYTLEGFRDARNKLKPDGIIVMAVSLGKGEAVKKIVSKLFLMLQKTFNGKIPVVYKTDYDEGYTFIVGNQDIKAVINQSIPFRNITNEIIKRNDFVEPSTDNWPFIYMPRKKYPTSYIFIISLLLIISYIFAKNTAPHLKHNFSFPCFFLGCGFMFLEVKAITELGLIHGNTWIVISIAILYILIMAYFANMFVIRFKNLNSKWIYAGLITTLLLGFFLSKYGWSNFNPLLAKTFMPIVLTLPLFFSGIAFSSELKFSSSISSAMSSNLFGAMIGGFLEYNTMYFGFQMLYIIAIIMYLLGWLTSKTKIQ